MDVNWLEGSMKRAFVKSINISRNAMLLASFVDKAVVALNYSRIIDREESAGMFCRVWRIVPNNRLTVNVKLKETVISFPNVKLTKA